jgi:hypothetical protein
MRLRIIGTMLILLILLTINLVPINAANNGKNKNKDKDRDGVPDYLDNDKTNQSTNVSKKTSTNSGFRTSGFSGDNWEVSYGSDITYGAYIEDVKWNSSYYICTANVPWIKIDNVEYQIPDDFISHGNGHTNSSSYYLVYQLYSININEVNHSIEVLWYFWKSPVNGAGKLDVSVLHSTYSTQYHSLFAGFRFDFDIIDSGNDYFNIYGIERMSVQSTEAFQFCYLPVDPIWGMKVKQIEYTNSKTWAGIKAWSTSETNYLLRFHTNEYKGDPINYIECEDVYREDDLIWTTASTFGPSPRYCGPTVFFH